MKKLLLFALLACFSVVANATDYCFHLDTYPWNYSASPAGKIEINFTSQWGEFKLISETVSASEYTGWEVVISEISNLNEADDEQNKDVQFIVGGSYVDIPQAGTYSGEISEDISTFELQACEAGATCTVKSAYLIKADGSKDKMIYGGPSWGCEYTCHEVCDITFTGQYGGIYLVDAETGEPATYSVGGEELTITIKLSEAAPVEFLVELDNASSGIQWYNFDAGSTEYSFTINDEMVSEDVAYIYIKANSEDSSVYPYTMKFESIYSGAAASGDEVTAYFDSSSVDWDPVYCYVFGGSDPWPHITADWPGEVCEYLGDNIWKWTYTGSEEVTDWKIIFCNEAGTSQTSPDFDFYNGGLYNTSGYVGEYTGITSIVSETTSAKVTGIYNLAGQRVNENTKGILIKDGKKVLVK